MVNTLKIPTSLSVKWPKWLNSIPIGLLPLVVEAKEIDDQFEGVSTQTARWGVSRIDHTSLSPTKNEGEDTLQRLVVEGSAPYPVQGICVHGEERIAKTLAGFLHAYPSIHLAFTSNFPHGDLPVMDAAKNIKKIAGYLPENSQNPIDIDTVIDYGQWLDLIQERGKGRKEKLALFCKKLLAEKQACVEQGFLWKVIQKANVHVVADRPHESLYLSSIVSMICGADYVKTCTGMAAKPPYHNLVSADASTVENIVAMFSAISDFNNGKVLETVSSMSSHAQEMLEDILEVSHHLGLNINLDQPAEKTRYPKVSGGQRNEVDVARVRFLVQNMLGDEFLNSVIIGASDKLRLRLLRYIKENDPTCNFSNDDIRLHPDNRHSPSSLQGLKPSEGY